MKNFNKLIFAIIILVITSGSLFAQVTFRMKRPPLNQLKSADLWNATIINTGEAFTAYIYGSMKNNEDGEMIATGQTMTFEVKKGTTNFKISDLPKIPDVSYLAKDPKYKKSFMNTGGAPPGDYKICCELRRKDNTVAGDDCFDQKIAGGDAPQLISPSNEEQLKIDNPIFTWMHIKSPTSNQTYTLKIVEIKGDQSPETALRTNKPIMERDEISLTLFQYPVSAPKLEKGKKYVWFIKIGDLQSTANVFSIGTNPIVTDACSADSIIINTGYNHNTNSLYPMNSYDNFWIVTSDPYPSTIEPRPACVLSSNSPWGSSALTNFSRWISFHPISDNSGQNVTFDYRFRFCLGANFTNVVINMQMMCDDEADILVNGNNAGSTPSQPFPCGDCNHSNIRTFQINNQNFFHSGCNEIIIRVKNVYGVATGLIIKGSIKASSGLKKMTAGCCPCLDPTGCINGFKWNDLNGDGIRQNNEPLLPNWQINLSNGQTVLTDTLGYYFFTELPAGAYTVTETNQSNCTQTFPVSGSHTVNLGSSETVSNINFGNNCSASPCDSFKVVQVQNPVGNCCWSLNLTHPSSTTNITGIQFSVLSPNSFVTGSSQLGSSYNSGWIYTANTPQEFAIKKLGGNIPAGQLNGFFDFCLNKLSSPQHVVVKWLRNDSSVVCSDTVTLNCDIPCVTFNNDTLICNGNNYNWNYSFINNSTFPINKIEVVSTNPTGISVFTPTMTLSTTVNQGQTSIQITNSISGLAPNSSGCIVLKFTSPDGCCWCYDTLCVTAPSCVCKEVGASVSGDPLNCCFNLNLQNNYSSNYFTQVRLRTLESGVYFSTWNTNTSNNWYTTNTFPDNVIYLIKDPSNYPNSFIPTGNLSNVMNFCLTNYSSSTQHILLEWMRNDSVKCTDTLVTNCVPPPPVTPCVQLINDSLTCQPDGTFKYTFHIKNNSSHTTTGFQFNPISPSGISFNPANFSNVTIAPNMISPQQTMIISGVTSGSQFCFNISLYEHVLISGQQYYDWCCYSTEICKTVPNCNVGQGCINSKLDSLWCIKDPTGIKKYGYTISLINLTPSTGNFVLSNSCGTLLGTNTGSIPANSTISVSGQFTTTHTGNCCIITKMFIYTPVKTDSCLTELCFTLPKCDSTVINNDTCKCGQWLEPWPDRSEEIKLTSGNMTYYVDCNYNNPTPVGPFNAGEQIKYEASYQCNPYQCNPVYDWYLINTSNSQTISSGTNVSMPIYFTPPSNIVTKYQFIIIPKCSGNKCDSCGFYFTTTEKTDCNCKGNWKSKSRIEFTDGKTSFKKDIKCFDDGLFGPVKAGTNINYSASLYVCSSDNCATTYLWNVVDLYSNTVVNSGTTTSFPVTFPAPTEGRYKFTIIANCGGKNCDSCGFSFYTVGKSDCDCGGWKNKEVQVEINYKLKHPILCGENLTVELNSLLILSFPDFICRPEKCTATYSWDLIGGSGIIPVHESGTDNPFKYEFNTPGSYNLTFKAYCGGKVCDSCVVKIDVQGDPHGDCDCGKWVDDWQGFKIHGINVNPNNVIDAFVPCGKTYSSIFQGVSLDFVSQTYKCVGDDNCKSFYKWIIESPIGSQTSFNTISFTNFQFNEIGTYKVNLKVLCNGKECDKCLSYIKVIKRGGIK